MFKNLYLKDIEEETHGLDEHERLIDKNQKSDMDSNTEGMNAQWWILKQ